MGSSRVAHVPSARALAALLLLSTAAASQVLQSPHFALPVNFAADTAYVGHFDADDLPDVVFAAHTSPQARVLLVVTGSTGAIVTSPLPDKTLPLAAVADIDGDGLDDVVTCPEGGGNLTVSIALGGGTFGGQFPLAPLYVLPFTALEFADLTGDGRTDLVVGQANHQRLTLYPGDGAGGFGAPSEIGCCVNPQDLSFGDLDDDGLLDIVTHCSIAFSQAVTYTLGHGDGTFDAPVDVPELAGTDGAFDTLVADVTGDGHDDLVACCSSSLKVLQWHGQPVPWSATPNYGSYLASADFDQDGLQDVAVAHVAFDSTISVLLQGPGGTFAPEQRYGGCGLADSLTAVDMDLDGWTDLVSSGQEADGFVVLRGRPQGQFAPLYGYAAQPLGVALSDLDGDGRLDLVTAHGKGQPVQVRVGLLFGDFAAPLDVDSGPGADALEVLDATGDGLPDLLSLTRGPDGSVSLAPGLGDMQFGAPQVVAVPDGDAADFAVGQFMGNGLPDVAVLVGSPRGQCCSGEIVLWENLAGTLVPHGSFGVANHPVSVTAGDLDDDGLDDLVVGALSAYQYQAYLSLGGGAFQLNQAEFLNGEPLLLSLGDADADGKLDLLEPYYFYARVHWGLGHGMLGDYGQFTMKASLAELSVGDFTGDGLPDLVSANVATINHAEFAVAAGLGGRAFAAPQVSSLGALDATALAIGDADGDGTLDAVAMLPEGQQVAVLRNATGPWHELGHSLAGSAGLSELEGAGTAAGGTAVTLRVSGAAALTPTWLLVGLAEVDEPFHGGILVPAADAVLSALATDGEGELLLAGTWPQGVPSGLTLFLQAWFKETGGFAASTAVSVTTP